MTIRDSAQDIFDALGLDRADVQIIAKSVGQRLIDESKETEQPLQGMVYDVQTLYDEGMPDCTFEDVEEEGVLFRGYFRANEAGKRVERRRVLSRSNLQSLVEQLPRVEGVESSS